MLKSLVVISAILLSATSYPAPSDLQGDPIVGDVGTLVTKEGKIKFIIITTEGYVSFEAANNWIVLDLKSKPPLTVTLFQLLNTADQETKDSTNLVISFITENSEKTKTIISKIGIQYGENKVTTNTYKELILYVQQNLQEQTLYDIYDAKKKVADVLVAVRIAWPHLPKNSTSYDKEMQTAFYSALDSIEGKKGTYQVQAGEFFKRPD